MASEVMLAPATAPGTRREIDDVRDMVRNATVTTVYVSHRGSLLAPYLISRAIHEIRKRLLILCSPTRFVSYLEPYGIHQSAYLHLSLFLDASFFFFFIEIPISNVQREE